MAKKKPRPRIAKKPAPLYFDDADRPATFPSGCTLLDCVLGGGWAEGRVSNVVGDKSTGKTLQAIEASANFLRKYPKGVVHYSEVEAAFDLPYARRLGMPAERIEFTQDCFTVQDWFRHLGEVCDRKSKQPALCILDSLDGLSDEKELESKIEEGTYGTAKAKLLSRLFRTYIQRLRDTNTTVMVISQIRDKIGVTFGKSSMRTGGKALDFYSSQVIWLNHKKRLVQQRKGVKRAYGVLIQAKCEKNKVGDPFGECEYPILFNYGIEDLHASLEFLKECKRLDLVGVTATNLDSFKRKLRDMEAERYNEYQEKITAAVRQVWCEVRDAFLPKRGKYG